MLNFPPAGGSASPLPSFPRRRESRQKRNKKIFSVCFLFWIPGPSPRMTKRCYVLARATLKELPPSFNLITNRSLVSCDVDITMADETQGTTFFCAKRTGKISETLVKDIAANRSSSERRLVGVRGLAPPISASQTRRLSYWATPR